MDLYFAAGVVFLVIGGFLLAFARFVVRKPSELMHLDFPAGDDAAHDSDAHEEDDYFGFLVHSLKLFFYGLAVLSLVGGAGLLVVAAVR